MPESHDWERKRIDLTEHLMEYAKRVLEHAGPVERIECTDQEGGFQIVVQITRLKRGDFRG